jgi:fructose-specific phosphotransferase system IIC component
MRKKLFIMKFMWASTILIVICFLFRGMGMEADASSSPIHSLLFRVAMGAGCLAFGFIIALIDAFTLKKQEGPKK